MIILQIRKFLIGSTIGALLFGAKIVPAFATNNYIR